MWTFDTERRTPIRLGLAAVLTLLWALPCATASTPRRPKLVEHKVKRGQTLAGLALDYYRDRYRYENLARINDIKPPYRLETGRMVRVPISSSYRVRSGDTPSGIAQRLLGGASRYKLLMELNGLPSKGSLRKGQGLEIPAVLTHTLGRGETLGALAKRYYGDASRASWIARFNGISRPDRVKRGTRLEVPLVGFLPSSSSAKPKPPQRSAKRHATAQKPKPAAKSSRKKSAPSAAVQHAIDLYHQGEYRKAASRLDKALQRGSLRRGDRTLALRFRAYCAVATGDLRTASRTFRALHKAAPSWKPNPSEDSPKIRRAFSKAISGS